MDDYKPYIPADLKDEFDEFCVVYRKKGARINEEAAMVKSFDPEVVDLWRANVLDQGRLECILDIDARCVRWSVPAWRRK